MAASALCLMTLSEVADLIGRREVSPVEVTRAVLDRIHALNPRLGAFISVQSEAALESAAAAERAIQSGAYRGPLHGVPLSLKDNIATAGVITTAGGRLLADWVPDEDATVTARLKAAGAVLVGKTNLHEYAYGGTTTNLHYGAAHNPWDLERVPGGSSGGSGAAVATGLGYGSLGTDTGGSIRLPACQCSVVGLKPTYGRVSRHGVIPLSWSLDHVGPLTRSVRDAALMLAAIAGYDPRDRTSSRRLLSDYTAGLDGDVRGLRVGVPRRHFFEVLDPEVKALVEAALKQLEDLGATLREVDLPHVRYSNSVLWTTILSEASTYHHANLRTRGDLYGTDIRPYLVQGEFVPAVAYLQAQRLRQMLVDDMRRVLEDVDVLATPSLAIVSPKIGQSTVEVGGKVRELNAVFIRITGYFNLTGSPAIVVPCGFTPAGLPTSLQIVGRPFDEATVLRVAHAYEASTTWHARRPPL